MGPGCLALGPPALLAMMIWSTLRMVAAAFAAKGIRVNALAPGTVMTDMVMNNTPEAVESMQKAAFMGRGADPDEMVGPALLLCSDAGSFITGQALSPNGGYHMSQ